MCVVVIARAATAVAATPVAAPLAQSATATDRQDLDVALDAALEGCRLRAIELAGLQRTIDKVVLRELVVRPGQPLRQPALRESVRRLRNLGIFRRVDADVRDDGDGGCTLALRVDEKWTLLPIVSLGRGGGIAFLTVGVQDSHLLGRLLQLEGYWQLFGGVHSGGIVFADPRLLDRRLSLQLSLGLSRRNRARFDPEGAPLAGWSRHRKQVGLEFADLRRPERIWRASAWWIDDRFDAALLPEGERAAARALGLPERRSWLLASAGATLGRIDKDDYLERGLTLDLGLLAAVAPPGSGDGAVHRPWLRGTLAAKAAWLPLGRLNLVARVVLAQISRPVEEFGLYVGGLDGVRGLPDSRFFGRVLAVANAEARLPSYHGRLLALQHVAFVDVGRTSQDGAGLLRDIPVSLGTGVRLIVPKVARLVARLDVAWVFERRDGWLVSFGAQQAF